MYKKTFHIFPFSYLCFCCRCLLCLLCKNSIRNVEKRNYSWVLFDVPQYEWEERKKKKLKGTWRRWKLPYMLWNLMYDYLGKTKGTKFTFPFLFGIRGELLIYRKLLLLFLCREMRSNIQGVLFIFENTEIQAKLQTNSEKKCFVWRDGN